jgi:hypothetical protein
MMRSTFFRQMFLLCTIVLAVSQPIIAAETTDDLKRSDAAKRDDALSTAVALNYCRASFHRIRKNPSEAVLLEEQEKILNNLNLSQLNDPEVIALYTSVLDEIGQIGLADKERELYRKNHAATIRRQITWDAVAFGTDLMTAQFGSAVRTGANSWWDYRNNVFQKEADLHKIDKARVTTVVQRSSQFLDTFWKLARKKNIPDRWLVRGDDLDQLEVSMQEKDPEVRLRVLRRMEPFMEAYPPYWYYVARTRQEMGQLVEAIDVYQRVEKLGDGHFRKDELLSTALANLAAIEDYLGKPGAVASAEKSLNYATDVWEANLMAARILQRNGRIAEAEDAILRNLDVDLEQSQSHVFLASLYYFSRDSEKLVAMLNDPSAVAHLPAPVLLRCATLVGTEKTPPLVVNNILASLEAFPRSGIGNEQILVRVGYAWQLHLARLEAYQDGNRLPDPQVATGKGYYDLRFAVQDRGFSLPGTSLQKPLTLVLTYPDATSIKLVLRGAGESDRPSVSMASGNSLRITSVRLGDETFGFRMREAHGNSNSVRIETAKPDPDDAAIPNLPAAQRLPGTPASSASLMPDSFDR